MNFGMVGVVLSLGAFIVSGRRSRRLCDQLGGEPGRYAKAVDDTRTARDNALELYQALPPPDCEVKPPRS